MKRILRIVSLVMAAVLCLSLLTACGSKASKLKGTWSVKETEEGMTGEVKLTFKSGGKGEMKMTLNGKEIESKSFKWEVDDDELTIKHADGGGESTYKWSKDAKDGENDCWYIDGKTLYLDGMEFKKG